VGLNLIPDGVPADLLGLKEEALHGDQIAFANGEVHQLKMRIEWPA
jgi:hypothetical protein